MSTGNNVKYKLRNIYSKINRSGLNEFSSYEEFEDWSMKNGYAPWKVLSLIFKEDGYREDNCMWVVDKRGMNTARPIEEDDSLDNVMKNIKMLAYNSNELSAQAQRINNVVVDMLSNKVTDRESTEEALKIMNTVNEKLRQLNLVIDKMKIVGLEDNKKTSLKEEVETVEF